MNAGHVIRLNSLWKRVLTGFDGEIGQAIRVTLPDDSLRFCQGTSVEYSRSFNKPSGLDVKTRVMLECGLVRVSRSVLLNRHRLPTLLISDVTSLLLPNNRLTIVIDTDRFSEASQATALIRIISEEG